MNEIIENEKLKVGNSPSRLEGVGCETARGSANLKTNRHSVLDTESPKNVPKLRFKEFDDEWVEKKLGDVAIFYNTKRVPLTESDREKGDYPYYGASGIIDYVKDYIFDGEYILLGEDGANIVLRNSRLVFLAKGRFWVNNHAHVFQSKESNYFLCETLERINYSKYNTGTAQPKLNSDIVKKIKINLPTLPEQQKIADCLSTWDESIENLKQIIENKKLYKKGMMQKIFSQEIRFKDGDGADYPAWVEKKLGEVCDIKKGTQLNKDNLTTSGDYLAISGGISESGYTNVWNTEKNTITISEGGNSCGYVNFIRTRFWSGGHNYSIQNVIEIVGKIYLYQYLKFNQLSIMRLRVGSGLPNIQKSDISKFIILTPCPQEQTKIANFLSTLDDEVEILESQLAELELQKKGLMQGMFV